MSQSGDTSSSAATTASAAASATTSNQSRASAPATIAKMSPASASATASSPSLGSVAADNQVAQAPTTASPDVNGKVQLVAQFGIPQAGGTVQYLGRDVPIQVVLSNPKQFYQEFTFWISIVAIVVSLLNYYLTRSNSVKSRRQSIDDEFWLRKVLYPLSIEPALEFYSKILNDLPKDRFQADSTSDAVLSFQTVFNEGHRGLVAKTFSLKIASITLFNSISGELEKIEDLISEYCAANQTGFMPDATGTDHQQGQTESLLGGHLSSILGAIKAHQVDMK